jgi:hypothetical protein
VVLLWPIIAGSCEMDDVALDIEKKRRTLLEGGLILLATFFAGTLMISYLIASKDIRLLGSVMSGAIGVSLCTLFIVPRLSESFEERIWAYSGLSMGLPFLLSFPLLFHFNINLMEPEFFSLFFITAIPSTCGFGFLIFEVLSDHYGQFGGFKIKRVGSRIILTLLLISWYVLMFSLVYALLASIFVSRYTLIVGLLVASLTLAITIGKVQRFKELLGKLERGAW